jgi:3-hydroxyisobutyrate dehydrogenase
MRRSRARTPTRPAARCISTWPLGRSAEARGSSADARNRCATVSWVSDISAATSVTGGVHRAEAGEITIFVGGAQQVFELHRAALEAMGSRVIHLGGIEQAAVTKVVTNMLAFIHLIAVGEALMLCAKGGVDLATAFRAIAASSGSSFVHESESQVILNGSYDIGFTMELACKDAGFAVEFGRRFGVPLRLAAVMEQTFVEGRARYGKAAWSSMIVKLLEDAVGMELRAPGFPAQLGPEHS